MPQLATLPAIVGGIVGAVSGAIATVIMVLNYRQQRAQATPEHGDGHLLDQAADQLAETIERQWHEQEQRRRIHDPFPLPIRWVNASDELIDHWSNILLQGSTATSRSLNLSGRLDRVNEIFDKVPSGRIVVLGKAGSGKTILTLRYVLGALDRRNDNNLVPVILSVGSWDPKSMSLREWLIHRLIDEYPGLRRSFSNAVSLAAALVDNERILPVLDGFDEIAEELRSSALTALNATTSPLVLTSRPNEYQAAVDAADVLSGAAVVNLVDLTVTDLAGYLPRTTRKMTQDHLTVTKWDPVLAQVRQHPDQLQSKIVKAVLATPLMVGLARAIYSDTKDGDPRELLNGSRFNTAEMLEDHLLDVFIPAVYQYQNERPRGRVRRSFSAESAMRWLGHLAADLDQLGSRDLAWWQLRDTICLRTRMLVCALVAAVGAGVLLGLIWKFGLGLGLGFGVGIGLVRVGRAPISVLPRIRGRGREFAATVIGGVVGGIAGALVGGVALELTHSTKGLILGPLVRSTNESPLSSATTVIIGVATGLTLATLAWSGIRRTSSQAAREIRHLPEWVMTSSAAASLCLVAGLIGSVALGLKGGLALGIALGISAGAIIGLEAPLDIRTAASSLGLLRTDRRNALFSGVLLGLTLGIAVLIATWSVIGPLKALVLSLGCCLMQGVAVSLAFTAWGHWIIFTRGWLSLTAHLPLALPDFIADAHQRGVLRQAGAVYQFRHARLQDRLAVQRRDLPGRS